MDGEKLRALAVQLSSEDFSKSRDAVRELKALLSPEKMVAAWRDDEQRPVLEQLLAETEEVGNSDVYGAIGGCIERALLQDGVGPQLLAADTSLAIAAYVLHALSHSDISLAARAHPAALALMRVAGGDPAVGAQLGAIMDEKLRAEAALRLFDCDAVESVENLGVYTFLTQHTHLIAAILAATVEAFDTDPLLLANYLVVSGVIAQREPPCEQLVRRVESVLAAHSDDMYVAFVCRYCSIVLYNKEVNAAAHAANWVRASLSPALLERCGEDAVDAVLDLAGSAGTTASGWRAVVALLPLDWLGGRLRARSPALQLSALRFLAALLLSPYFDPAAVALGPALRDAWQLRSALEEPLRVAAWTVARAVVGNPVLRDEFAAGYASVLCGGAMREDCVEVRTLQLAVAKILRTTAALSDATKDALEAVTLRGLYPPGSAGVAEMTKD